VINRLAPMSGYRRAYRQTVTLLSERWR